MDLRFNAYRRTDCRWDMPRPHLHGELEVLFPLSDGDDIFIDNVSYPLRRGTLFLMDTGVPHRSRACSQSRYERCVLHFPPETAHVLGVTALPRLLTGHGCCAVLSEEEFSLCSRLFERLTGSAAGHADELRRTAAFVELLALVVEKWSAPASLPLPAADDGVMSAVVSHIRAHLTEELSLDSLAEQFFLSKSALCHRFKAATGFTVMEYVILCRVRYAGTLLRRGMSVRLAGEAAGFGDNAHFIRTFRRITGMTPGQYAKEQKT